MKKRLYVLLSLLLALSVIAQAAAIPVFAEPNDGIGQDYTRPDSPSVT